MRLSSLIKGFSLYLNMMLSIQKFEFLAFGSVGNRKFYELAPVLDWKPPHFHKSLFNQHKPVAKLSNSFLLYPSFSLFLLTLKLLIFLATLSYVNFSF